MSKISFKISPGADATIKAILDKDGVSKALIFRDMRGAWSIWDTEGIKRLMPGSYKAPKDALGAFVNAQALTADAPSPPEM